MRKKGDPLCMILILCGLSACKKKEGEGSPQPPLPRGDTTIYTNPVAKDPQVANTIGFCLEDWSPKPESH